MPIKEDVANNSFIEFLFPLIYLSLPAVNFNARLIHSILIEKWVFWFQLLYKYLKKNQSALHRHPARGFIKATHTAKFHTFCFLIGYCCRTLPLLYSS